MALQLPWENSACYVQSGLLDFNYG